MEQVDERRDEYGNHLLKLRPVAGQGLTVSADVILTPFSVRGLLHQLSGEVGPEQQPFLTASAGIHPDDPQARQVAAELLEGPLVERVAGIMRWANARLEYGVPGSPPGLDESVDVLRRGGGHCEALSSAITACLRAAKVPARMIRGQSAIVGQRGVMKQHTIVSYWLPGIGWCDWDHQRPEFESRADFVRLMAYNGSGEPQVAPAFYFQGREFSGPNQYRNGPYLYELVGRSLD